MRGAISPLPNTPSWLGAQLKDRGNFSFRTNGRHYNFWVQFLNRRRKFLTLFRKQIYVTKHETETYDTRMKVHR